AEAVDAVANPGAVGRIPWTVNINGSFTMPKKPATSILSFAISGKTPSGKSLQVKAGNRLRIPAFKVTPNEKLRRIMIHEFPKDDGKGTFGFDEAAVQAELDKLTAQQRKLLATLDPGPSGNRLVAFITLQKENDLRMHADICQPDAFSIKPNATFAVFHCQGAGKEVSLVCFVRHFVFNMINPETNTLVHQPQGKKKADEWLARVNPTPPVFKIGCFARLGLTDGTFWNRIYTPTGKTIMGGNTMHGMINTVGCWMLFRNFNFPKQNDAGTPIEDELDRILNRMVRHKKTFSKKAIRAALNNAGYDAPDSGVKFIRFDANHAYAWFFREVVGARYFSKTFFGRGEANDKHAHQLTFAKSGNQADVDQFIKDNGDGPFIYHHIEDRLKEDKSFKFDDSLLGPNALGFQACKRFCDGFDKNLKASEVADRTWADLYIYRADDLPVKQFKQAFFAKI
ncbi:MAG: hypothetical protein M3Y08_11025, partial [Fibrobacterota bacterium]|nr:hypothetical protein [Fibrobacterota bacterium]